MHTIFLCSGLLLVGFVSGYLVGNNNPLKKEVAAIQDKLDKILGKVK